MRDGDDIDNDHQHVDPRNEHDINQHIDLNDFGAVVDDDKHVHHPDSEYHRGADDDFERARDLYGAAHYLYNDTDRHYARDDYLAAVRAVYNAAAAVLGVGDNPATDRPDDNDAMRAYILERARYDAGIADHADIFRPLRDAARGFLAATGDSVTP